MMQTPPPIMSTEKMRAFVPLARGAARADSLKQVDRTIPSLTWTEGGIRSRVCGLLSDINVTHSDAHQLDAIVRAVMEAIEDDDLLTILNAGIENRIYEHIALAVDLATVRNDPAELAYASGNE